MFIFKEVSTLQKFLQNQKGKIGFVPTMGAIHNGHLSLIKKSTSQNSITVCSIFVNPTQFDETRDLAKYPRMEAQDAKMLFSAGCDVVFIPSVEEVYPGKSQKRQLKIDLKGVDKVLEGAYRSGHYEGVMQVVNRLIEIVKPTNIYLGQKDYQQFLIVEMMIKAMGHSTKAVCCEIIRETDGLAMSSRNLRLPVAHRKIAAEISKNLKLVKSAFNKTNVIKIKEKCINNLSKNFAVDYFEIVDAKTLQPIVNWNDAKQIIALTAARIGEIRLIDNMFITAN